MVALQISPKIEFVWKLRKQVIDVVQWFHSVQYPRSGQTLEDWHSAAKELKIEVYYKLSSLPRQTGLVVFWGPGSAINPSGHWHLYDPTVLLHVRFERHVSCCWHSSISKTKKPRQEFLLEIAQKTLNALRSHVSGRVIWLTIPGSFGTVIYCKMT